MKLCEDCLLEKSEEDFYQHLRTGASSVCKACTCKANKLRREDPEEYRKLISQRRTRRRLLLIPDHKVCTKCHVDKPLGAFRERSRGLYGRSSHCTECERAAGKSRRTGPRREELLELRRKQWAETERTPEQREAAKVRFKTWYGSNKSRHQASMRRWVRRNPEAFKAIQKKYLVKSPVHVRRRAHFLKVERTLTAAQWREILEAFNHCCAYCLRGDLPMTQDHMIPVSKGGAHSASNVVPACKSCNSRKNDRPIWVMSNVQGDVSHGTTC